MTLLMFGLTGLALAMLLFSTAMVEQHRHPRRPPRQRGGSGTSIPAAVTLHGEALFATGLDPETVLLDCLLGLDSAGGETPAALQPATLRVRHSEQEPPASLPDVVRAWAERGERVFVELPFSVKPWRARLRCGGRAVTVAVDNGGEVWRTIGSATRKSAPGRTSIW